MTKCTPDAECVSQRELHCLKTVIHSEVRVTVHFILPCTSEYEAVTLMSLTKDLLAVMEISAAPLKCWDSPYLYQL